MGFFQRLFGIKPVTQPIMQPAPPIQQTFVNLDNVPSLSWEASQKVDRKSWSQTLWTNVMMNLSTLDKAYDISQLCEDYRLHSISDRTKIWCELFIAIAFFESSWSPSSASQDVGSSDKDTWSVGLLQLSVIDQESYNIHLGYSYADLQVPEKNLTLGVAIMTKQIVNYGHIFIKKGETGLYWATIHPGGKYDESANVIQRVKNSTKELS